jgi:predicted acylesterase/phospholipase RssA
MARGKTALVLGGGAPHLTLMSGALSALLRAGVQFDLVSMAGGGSVVGLLYLSPKGLRPEQALENTVNFGVADLIYSTFPVNYKLFNKSGAAADAFRKTWADLPAARAAMSQYGMTKAQKLVSDWILFIGAMICPTDVNYFSTGFCAHVPFIEHVVDFDRLKHVKADCLLSAYCVDEDRVVSFRKDEIGVHHFRASMSFPFIYPPYRLNGKLYYEGAAYQCLPLARLVQQENIDHIVLIDVMTINLIQLPRNLWDAYAQSIILPLVANARNELAMFEDWIKLGSTPSETNPSSPATTARPRLLRVRFEIPERYRPRILDWSSSNLETMFDLGVKAGNQFLKDPENSSLLKKVGRQ